METHTGLGFAGAGTPTSAGGGYVYMRNRWYDPQTGRFLSQDPIGLAGGVNLYAYAGNNPTSFSDPFGLCLKEPCPTIVQRVVDRLKAWRSSIAGRAAEAYAQGLDAISRGIDKMLPGTRRMSQGLAGVGSNGEQLSTGQSLTAVALGAAELGGNGIGVTDAALAHVVERHTVGGSLTAGKSIFNEGEDVLGLVRQAEDTAATAQARGSNFQRVIDAGREIGTDRATGAATSTYTVVTDGANSLVTAFPGTP